MEQHPTTLTRDLIAVEFKMSDLDDCERLLAESNEEGATTSKAINEDSRSQEETKDKSSVKQVFSMFKTYLEEKLDEKGKEIELKGQKEKDVVKLIYKANIQKENQQGKQNTRIEKLAFLFWPNVDQEASKAH